MSVWRERLVANERAGDSDRTFPDLTTDSNCHRPTTTSLSALSPLCQLASSCLPLPLLLLLLLSTAGFPSASLCRSPSLFSRSCACPCKYLHPCTRRTYLLAERDTRVLPLPVHTLSLTCAPPPHTFSSVQLPLALGAS